jgi:hypothetical protein
VFPMDGAPIRISQQSPPKVLHIYIYASMVNKFLRSQIMQTNFFFNVTIS